MRKLFDPYIVLVENFSDDLAEEYKENLLESINRCMLTGCSNGMALLKRELDEVNENALKYHIEINICYTRIMCEHFNEKFSIN